MQDAPIPVDEEKRIEAVHRLAILDTKPEERFDILTQEVVKKLNVSMSMVTILDSNREWFKSCVGLDKKEGDRAASFCGHALLAKNIFVVEDTLKDPRFADNPMVVGFPFIRFYAGVALFDYKTRQPIGVFCVKDTKPKKLTVQEIAIIIDLANKAEKELNK
ncbi:GAF domain-containing protein [Candidatus Nomurabacteria bacterium]|nr:GAF domain-containing protein [Candidatus Nomurabacteria bacterium]